MDDKQNYRVVNDAMKISNFDKTLIKTIWSVVASIIHLGNVKFESNETDLNNNSNNVKNQKINSSSEKSSISQAQLSNDSLKEIKIIARLLKVDESDLIKSLTTRLIASGSKELVTTYHSVKEANYARDALAKVKNEQIV